MQTFYVPAQFAEATIYECNGQLQQHDVPSKTSASQDRRRLLSEARAARCRRVRGLQLDMSRIHPECPHSDPSDRSVAADVLLREEPDAEEDEEEDEGNGKNDGDDDEGNDGYSE
jgi:hypothetical protein